ncbi:hypothetical protein [Massilia aquatica]|uniref:IS1 family transposase n=1 Tax=Massilia aquatica TaxID=2609000 RepID=A0ABX0MEB9_9BURK|nr:hypothetical protein [Massilia aquatica]NHZ42602.1 hypothetical protein [Massilia aquatica]
MSEISCIECGGDAVIVSEVGIVRLYRCEKCGKEFYARVHYVHDPISLGIKTYKAKINAADPTAVTKLRIKVRKVFSGKTNFRPDDLDRQIASGLPWWDLGFYSEDELSGLESSAKKMNLDILFELDGTE